MGKGKGKGKGTGKPKGGSNGRGGGAGRGKGKKGGEAVAVKTERALAQTTKVGFCEEENEVLMKLLFDLRSAKAEIFEAKAKRKDADSSLPPSTPSEGMLVSDDSAARYRAVKAQEQALRREKKEREKLLKTLIADERSASAEEEKLKRLSSAKAGPPASKALHRPSPLAGQVVSGSGGGAVGGGSGGSGVWNKRLEAEACAGKKVRVELEVEGAKAKAKLVVLARVPDLTELFAQAKNKLKLKKTPLYAYLLPSKKAKSSQGSGGAVHVEDTLFLQDGATVVVSFTVPASGESAAAAAAAAVTNDGGDGGSGLECGGSESSGPAEAATARLKREAEEEEEEEDRTASSVKESYAAASNKHRYANSGREGKPAPLSSSPSSPPSSSSQDVGLAAASTFAGEAAAAAAGEKTGDNTLEQQEVEEEGNALRLQHSFLVQAPSYRAMQGGRGRLPASQAKSEVLSCLSKHDVVVVCGETGSGKTTQVPQFVLDDALCKGTAHECSIVVTQPRRISAVSVAERIAAERGGAGGRGGGDRGGKGGGKGGTGRGVEQESGSDQKEGTAFGAEEEASVAHAVGRERLGGTAGYQIRGEARCCASTRLLLCTTGVLLRKLASDPLLQAVSHVVVDEVHERDVHTDFLLIILRDLILRRRRSSSLKLHPKLKPLKVVLMSATMQPSLFLNYFQDGGGGDAAAGRRDTPPSLPPWSSPTVGVVLIPGRRFPVSVRYYEEVLEVCGESKGVGRKGRRPPMKRPSTLALTATTTTTAAAAAADVAASDGNGGKRSSERLKHHPPALLPSSVALSPRADSEPLDFDLIAKLVGFIAQEEGRKQQELQLEQEKQSGGACGVGSIGGACGGVGGVGAVLVFLPGLAEIEKLVRLLRMQASPHLSLLVLPLHSALSSRDQRKVFQRPTQPSPSQPSQPSPPVQVVVKVIVATNIAETSVTIEDVCHVVDCGQVKEVRYHTTTPTDDDDSDGDRTGSAPTPSSSSSSSFGVQSLERVWCSKAAATQRCGRAGRTRPGSCWRVYPREWWGEEEEGEIVKGTEEEEEGEEEQQHQKLAPSSPRSLSPSPPPPPLPPPPPPSSSPSQARRLPLHSSPLARPSEFTAHTVPEMHRTALEDLVLQVMLLELGQPEEFLSRALEPPSLGAVRCAVAALTEIGALSKRKRLKQQESTDNDDNDDDDDDEEDGEDGDNQDDNDGNGGDGGDGGGGEEECDLNGVEEREDEVAGTLSPLLVLPFHNKSSSTNKTSFCVDGEGDGERDGTCAAAAPDSPSPSPPSTSTTVVLSLTALGHHLAHLPVDARLGKMLVLGVILGCAEPVLSCCAYMAGKSPFPRVGGAGMAKQQDTKARLAVLGSDPLAVAQLYAEWAAAGENAANAPDTAAAAATSTAAATTAAAASGHKQQAPAYASSSSSSSNGRRAAAQRAFCFDAGCSQAVLEQMKKQRDQFRTHLAAIGFCGEDLSKGPTNSSSSSSSSNGSSSNSSGTNSSSSSSSSSHKEEFELVRCVVCAGLWPRVARVVCVDHTTGSHTANLKRKVAMVDKRKSPVFLHPGSVNFGNLQRFAQPRLVPSAARIPNFLCFHRCVVTSKPYLHDVTFVGKYALLLFASGDLAITSSSSSGGGDGNNGEGSGGGERRGAVKAKGPGRESAVNKRGGSGGGVRDEVVVDGWCTIRIPEHGAVLCKLLRAELNAVLQSRIRRPSSSQPLSPSLEPQAVDTDGALHTAAPTRGCGLKNPTAEAAAAVQVDAGESRRSALALAAVRKLLLLDCHGSYSA